MLWKAVGALSTFYLKGLYEVHHAMLLPRGGSRWPGRVPASATGRSLGLREES